MPVTSRTHPRCNDRKPNQGKSTGTLHGVEDDLRNLKLTNKGICTKIPVDTIPILHALWR